MQNIQNDCVETTVYTNSYSEAKGTGVLSTLIFTIIVFATMFILAHFRG